MRRQVLLLVALEQGEADAAEQAEAAARLERAKEACEHVRRYIALRGKTTDVAPSWPDLDVLAGYVRDIPSRYGETQEDADARADAGRRLLRP